MKGQFGVFQASFRAALAGVDLSDSVCVREIVWYNLIQLWIYRINIWSYSVPPGTFYYNIIN